MYNPPHPGEVLMDTLVQQKGVSVTEAAKKLGVGRIALSRLLHGHASVSVSMALKLEKLLGGSAESWLHMQVAYDLWHARKIIGLDNRILCGTLLES